MRKSVLIFTIIFCFSVRSGPIFAQVVINEVYPQSAVGELEWVEIKNLATQSADLNGWYLEDLLSSPKTIFTFGQAILNSGQFLTASFSGQLNNSSDGVILKNSSGQIVSQMTYDSSTQGQSWLYDGVGLYISGMPTLGGENIIAAPIPSPLISSSPSPSLAPSLYTSPTPAPSAFAKTSTIETMRKIQLTQVATCPKNGSEWLELYNPSDEKILATIVAKDLQENSLPLNLEIDANQKKVVSLTRHIFNNSGDELFIFFDNQLLISKNLPACEAADTVFSFDLGSDWPAAEVITNTSEIAMGQSLFEPNLSNKEKSDFDTNSVKFIAQPNFKLPKINLEEVDLASATASVSDFEAQKVLGSAIVDNGFLSLQALFLICGGFLWVGVGIMEVYGFAFAQNKTLD